MVYDLIIKRVNKNHLKTFKKLCNDNKYLYYEYCRLYIKLFKNPNNKDTFIIINNMIYGLYYEQEFMNIIDFIPLKKSTLLRSRYDFIYNDMLYELKTHTYGINKYKTIVLNVDKLRYNNLCIIFGFIEGLCMDYYYIQYDKKKFDTYNKRHITTYGRTNYVYDIPKNDLIVIYKNGVICNDFKNNGFILNHNIHNNKPTTEEILKKVDLELIKERESLELITKHIEFKNVKL